MMGKTSAERQAKIVKGIVKKEYPNKFPNPDDLPLESLIPSIEKKGISLIEIRSIVTVARFKQNIEDSGIKLEGLVLDLCSGEISIASIYDKNKVICYDLLDDIVQELNRKEIKVVQGNIRDQILPFKVNSFDYLFYGGFNMAPYKSRLNVKGTTRGLNLKKYVKNIVEEIIRVTKKKAIITPRIRYFPKEYENRLEKYEDLSLMILNCKTK